MRIQTEHYLFNTHKALSKYDTLASELMSLDEKACTELTQVLGERLNKHQNLMHASRSRALLVVLQGMDTAGKDGVIRHVFRHISPLGVRAEAFGAPTEQELAHDFLWRIHQKTPARGEMVIFNRSHYEDVLVTKARSMISDTTCKARYGSIASFESLLHDEGTTIVKFMLHISKDEQKKRLQARLDDPHKRWKLQNSDFEDRQRWDAFQEAYQQAMQHTHQAHAPWYVIPADSKPHRDIIIGHILVDILENLKLQPPKEHLDLKSVHLR